MAAMPDEAAAGADKRVRLQRRLVEATLASMAASTLGRIDVHFADEPKNMMSLDQVVGRAAHTRFLENVEFLRLFAARYARLFTA